MKNRRNTKKRSDPKKFGENGILRDIINKYTRPAPSKSALLSDISVEEKFRIESHDIMMEDATRVLEEHERYLRTISRIDKWRNSLD